jgi:hypothetical protein
MVIPSANQILLCQTKPIVSWRKPHVYVRFSGVALLRGSGAILRIAALSSFTACPPSLYSLWHARFDIIFRRRDRRALGMIRFVTCWAGQRKRKL